MNQVEAGMTRDKPGKLTRRDFLGVASLVTATLGLQAGLALAPIQAEANINEQPAPANLWERLGALMLNEMQPDSSLYGQYVCGLPGHPVGCSCCL
ncbi:MAG: twin-arginine translocation signal domain-containing protein [Caldilineaceae bacterium SB0665_bin_21]|nr:twin-arginine translocation signal domain-containing protein [Caldilineaceae bacterium SB0665_bin_21]